jgi:hypothetical protein
MEPGWPRLNRPPVVLPAASCFPFAGQSLGAVPYATTTYTYDSNGNVLTATVPISSGNTATTTCTYNSFGEVLTVADPLGFVTKPRDIEEFLSQLLEAGLVYEEEGKFLSLAIPIRHKIGGRDTEQARDSSRQPDTVPPLIQVASVPLRIQ